MNGSHDVKRGIQILVVEDSPTDRLVTLTALEELRILTTVHVVENGVDAMAFLRREGRFVDAPRPDLMLLDLNLPKMDGREVLAQVKADPLLRFIPVIVLSTSKADEDIIRAYGEHANSYITKPVDLPQFGRALRELGQYWFEVVRLPSSDAIERLARRPKGQLPLEAVVQRELTRVLFVEDSESDAMLMKHSLAAAQGMRFEVTHARRLSEAKSLLESKQFDVVVTDLGLPDSTGLATYVHIQIHAQGLPVIVLTGVDDESTGLRALQRGAQEYLLKGELTGRGLARAIRYAVDRKQIHRQLLQSQRMDAVGQLAGGMAHDFNNLLTIVQANASLIQATSPTPEVTELAADILHATERGAALTRHLLAFSRKQVMEQRSVDLNEVVTSTSKMLRRIIKVELHLKGGLPLIQADVGMLEQVIVNLAVNARDAMPHGGKLTIQTRQEQVTSDSARALNQNAYPGNFVCMVVRDTGTGIDPSILDRIFDPFFTTKAANKGTGLGLSTIYGIIEQHRGWVSVRSELGHGTLFDIFLPTDPISGVFERLPQRPLLVHPLLQRRNTPCWSSTTSCRCETWCAEF